MIFHDFFFIYDFHRKGSRPYTTGEMNSAQFGAIVGQVNLAHQPPMVRNFIALVWFLFDFSLIDFRLSLKRKNFHRPFSRIAKLCRQFLKISFVPFHA